jgi:hypothetical protein
MTRRLSGVALRLLTLLLTLLLAIGLFSAAKGQGWLSPFGIVSEGDDSQVVQAIERTQEVSLLKLSVQGISDRRESGTIFGQTIPFSEEAVYLQYNFDAKLGFDGSRVHVARVGTNTYRVSVPEFGFIGYSDPTFELAVEDDGVLSFITPDVDQVEMVNEILDGDAQAEYLDQNRSLLEDQTKVFYDSLINSVDPTAKTEYEFSS